MILISKVAEYIPDGTKLGIDKILPARFLLPLMDKLPKTKFVDVSVLVDTTRMLKDEEEKELIAYLFWTKLQSMSVCYTTTLQSTHTEKI